MRHAIVGSILVVLVSATDASAILQRRAESDPVIKETSPEKVQLRIGNRPVDVLLRGSNLDLLAKARLADRGREAEGATASLLATRDPAQRAIQLAAGERTLAGSYQLEVFTAEGRTILVPLGVEVTSSTAKSSDPPPPTFVGVRLDGPDEIVEGQTAQFRAWAEFSDGSAVETPASSWSISGGGGAVVTPSGLVTAGMPDTTTVATLRADFVIPDGPIYSAEKSLLIRTWSLAIEGADEILEGDSQDETLGTGQYTLTFTDPQGASQTVTAAGWQIQNVPAFDFEGYVTPSGLVRIIRLPEEVNARVRATYTHGGATRYAVQPVTLLHRDPKLTGLTIRSLNSETVPPVQVPASVSLSAHASFRGQSAQNVTADAEWAIDPPMSGASLIASSASTRLLELDGTSTAQQVGVVATYGHEGITRSDTLWIPLQYRQPSNLMVTTPNEVLYAGGTMQLSAYAYYSGGDSDPVQPVWSVTGPATISDTGLLVADDVEQSATAQVTATLTVGPQTHTDTRAVTVHAPSYVDLHVLPSTTSANRHVMPGGSQLQLQAEAEFDTGDRETVPAAWSVHSGASFLSVSSTGLLTTSAVTGDWYGTIRAQYTHGGSWRQAFFYVKLVP